MDRGDIYHINLNPTQGRLQAWPRYVMIISPREFNKFGTPLVCPIALGGNFARDKGFTVPLAGAGMKVQGVVLCNQPGVPDLQKRNATFIDKVPLDIIAEVQAKLITLIE
jgi:mRNA-degrading endonuclease toxin of MazEF toxin-antitoxin module